MLFVPHALVAFYPRYSHSKTHKFQMNVCLYVAHMQTTREKKAENSDNHDSGAASSKEAQKKREKKSKRRKKRRGRKVSSDVFTQSTANRQHHHRQNVGLQRVLRWRTVFTKKKALLFAIMVSLISILASRFEQQTTHVSLFQFIENILFALDRLLYRSEGYQQIVELYRSSTLPSYAQDFGLWEIIVLFLFIAAAITSGRVVNRLCGAYGNPRFQPVITQLRHPSWSPRLITIRSLFRRLYLIQAPAIWFVWLRLRLQEPTAQLRTVSGIDAPFDAPLAIEDIQDEFIPLELLASLGPKGAQQEYFQILDDFGPLWQSFVHYLFPFASPFFSSPQLALFVFQFYLHLSWPVLFFRYKKVGPATAVAFGVWVLLNFTVRSFWSVSSVGAILLYPYFAWITTATALSFNIWVLNLVRGKLGTNSAPNTPVMTNTPDLRGTPVLASPSITGASFPSQIVKSTRGCQVQNYADDDGESGCLRRRTLYERIRNYFRGR
ncbi:hypothetical protein PROFUN_13809 [Planoprotostelium fungivorum]|uniref:Transmembrane protein n=1 Tax=Planoprotostelium fungivorum TaxID=1890364 RepID=A0A2P6N2Z9_9EUKA|nr:hypothetical protein PROFUN_13809 [Planoprotostelium fungivorum]